ncbi:hypothetical protein Tco_0562220 [Tanacetum coccineum]
MEKYFSYSYSSPSPVHFCCSIKGLEDKILVPKPPRNCARPSRYFRIISDDNTNVVNAPQEPFVGNQDPGESEKSHQMSFYTLTLFPSAVYSLDGILLSTLHSIQKKEEEKRIAEEQAAKDRSWKIPICYDDDEDDTIAIIPNTTPLNALNEHSEIVVNSDDDNSSSDDDSPYGEDIDYVDASPPDSELVRLEVVEIVDPEAERIDDDILSTIKDNALREKLFNVNLLIAKIDALRDNPTPSSDVVTKSTSSFPNLFLGGALKL